MSRQSRVRVGAIDGMFVSLKIYMLKFNSQCDLIWRWGLGEAMRSGGWSPHEWKLCLIKEAQLTPLALPTCEKWALTRHRIFWDLDLGLPRLQNCEK